MSDQLEYEIRLSPRRRTLAIEVHSDLRVIVRAPLGSDPAVVSARVAAKALWIRRQITRFRDNSSQSAPRQYLSGELHSYLGREYRLQIRTAKAVSVALTEDELVVALPGQTATERVRRILETWHRRRARQVFSEVLSDQFEPFRVRGHGCPTLSIRAMRTRWGSLSGRGRMTLNLALIRAPLCCIAYVVAHELCHLEHRGHGPAFYQLLDRVMPDWRARKQRLEVATL